MGKGAQHSRAVHLMGVPLDHGAGRRGVSMGPSAIRLARLHSALSDLGYEIHEHGDVQVSIPETLVVGNPQAKYLSVVAGACEELCLYVSNALDQGGFPLVIGGDHSIAMGSISGVALHLKNKSGLNPPKVGVLWFDAHADINTPESSPSGNIHGMPISCLLGKGPKELCNLGFEGPKLEPHRIVQVGLRDIDSREKLRIKESGIHAFTMADVDRRGISEVVAEAIELVLRDCDLLHVSFDIDVLDPTVAPGTGTPVRGGFTYREAHTALEMVAATGRLESLEVVEVNPILDQGNQTAEIAVGLIASALGQTIL